MSESEWVSPDPLQVERRIRALAPRLPDTQFFSHLTAACIWGLPLPSHGTGDPMHVSVLSPLPRPRANGLVGHELDPRVTRVVTVDGIPVSDPVSTWCQLAGILSLPDLVAVADALIVPDGDQPALCTIADLQEAMERRRGHRGAGQLRDALDLVRPGSCCRIQSVIRVMLHFAGLPEPALAVELRSNDSDWETTIPLGYRKYRVGIDVNLESNRAFRTRSAELERLARIDDLGWRMLGFSDADIHPTRLFELRQKIGSLQRLLMQQGWFPGDLSA